jgi:hypothetical protein
MKKIILLVVISTTILIYLNLTQNNQPTKLAVEPYELKMTNNDSLFIRPIKPIYPGRDEEKNEGDEEENGYYTEIEWKALDREEKKIIIDKFLTYITQAAKEESKVYPQIPYQLYVAQAVLESNYGCSYVAFSANNIYGHKYWGKDSTQHVTAKDDGPNDKFRVFDSKWFSLRAHSKLLMGMYWKRLEGEPTVENWLESLCGGKTLEESIEFVENRGSVYASACHDRDEDEVYYSDKIRRIIKCYDL